MAAAGDVFIQSLPEVSARELHVLAVDDSHVDRKVIERLLKISSCKGNIETPQFLFCFLCFFFFGLDSEGYWNLVLICSDGGG